MFDKHVSLMMFSKLSLHFKPTQKTKQKKNSIYIYIPTSAWLRFSCQMCLFGSKGDDLSDHRLFDDPGDTAQGPQGPPGLAWDFSSESHPANQRCLRLVWRWEKSPEPILNARFLGNSQKSYSPLIKHGQLGNPPTSHGGLVRWENHPKSMGYHLQIFLMHHLSGSESPCFHQLFDPLDLQNILVEDKRKPMQP